MELLLSVDLSTPEGSLAVHRYDHAKLSCLHETTLGGKLRHTEAFLPKLQEALTAAKLTLPEITSYLTTIGPGSFTGLRIALANLKALAFAHHRPIEVFRNSEIRLLHALREKAYNGSEALVLTQASVNRIAIGRFTLEESGPLLLSEDIVDVPIPPQSNTALVVHDADTLPWKSSWKNGEHLEVLLHASLLAEFREIARSRQVLRTEQEQRDLAPLYLGSRF